MQSLKTTKTITVLMEQRVAARQFQIYLLSSFPKECVLIQNKNVFAVLSLIYITRIYQFVVLTLI